VQGVKVLHMADVHLESPFGGMGLDAQRGRRRQEELKAVFVRAIDIAAEHDVDLLLLAGDLLDRVLVAKSTITFVDQQFRRIPRTRIFISPGNHDPLLPTSYYLSYPWAPNVHIFGPEVERVDLADLPVSVYGWGFSTWEDRECHVKSLRVADPTRINLVVLHGGEADYHPFTPQDLTAIGADYIALGHIHKHGTVLEHSGRVIARYAGSPEALHFGEPGLHGIYLGTIDKRMSRMEFVPTGLRQYISANVDVSGATSLDDLTAAIRQVDSEAARQQHCYRLTLTGTVDPAVPIEIGLLQEMLAPAFYLLRLADGTRPDYDLAAMVLERNARGLFVQRLLAVEAQAPSEALRQQARRALYLGLAALEGRGAR
jgi:exonuclease SbcD